MLLQQTIVVILPKVSCNPCYNGMLLQPDTDCVPMRARCNPCYNGMLLQLQEKDSR